MIALTPQFTTLLVALSTTVAVQGAPHHHAGRHGAGHSHRRHFGSDSQMSGLDIHAHLGRRLPARHFSAAREFESKHDESAYVASPGDDMSSIVEEDYAYGVPVYDHRPSRRGLDDPIDEPDEELQGHHGGGVHAQEADVPEEDTESGEHEEQDPESDSPQLSRRGYHVDSMNGPGLMISHVQPPAYRFARRSDHTVAIYDVQRRGLLDPLIPILGSLPGVGGLINLIGGTLGDVLSGLPILGPLLGGLLLSPHAPATAQGVTDANAPSQYFLDASSTKTPSTLYLVDSGRPSAFAIASQGEGNNTMYERLVSLQVAFVNAETGKLEPYCATFKGAENGSNQPSALTAMPCITDGMKEPPHPSQLWGYNPANNAIRPMWDDSKPKMRRAYVIKAAGGDSATVKEESSDSMDSVVLVFKPWELNDGGNSTTHAMFADPKEFGNWQAPETNGTTDGNTSTIAGEVDSTPEEPSTGEDPEAPPKDEEDGAKEENVDEGVPVFVAGAGRRA